MPPPIEADWEERAEIVDDLATRIADKLNMIPITRDDFLSGAMCWIVEQQHHFDPARGKFRAWCFRVLYNRGVDVIRTSARDLELKRVKREETRRELARNERSVREAPEPDEAPARDPADILEQHVPGQDRVFVAIDVQLLGRLAPERVAAWLRQASLPVDFPWQDLESIEKQAERRRALAALCGQDDGWLRQRIFRALGRIKRAEGVDS